MRVYLRALMVAVVLMGLCAGSARGQWSGFGRAEEKGEKVGVRAAVDRVPVRAGGEAKVVIELKVAAGWHVQSAVPHEGRFVATRVYGVAPAGVKAGMVKYPVGKDVRAAGAAKVSAYEGTVYIVVPVEVEAGAEAGVREWVMRVETQACDERNCELPTTREVRVKLDVGGAGATERMQENAVVTAAEGQTFYPGMALRAEPEPRGAGGAGGAKGDEAGAVKVIEGRGYRAANEERPEVWRLVAFALLGGMILNVMPCVLPVIPLKVLTLVQRAHGRRREAVGHALVFSAGVVSLFVALAVVLGTAKLGVYGSQYQSPVFMVTMAYVVLALGLSMVGVWTINPPGAVYAAEGAQGGGYVGSYMMGVLAALLATPCSAPLLGPVLAWALVQPLWLTVAAFGLVGVGMALPYVGLAAFPAGLDRLPRAGRWTELLKQGLGIVMVGVALYLVMQVRAEVWPLALAGGVVVAGVCWAWGQVPTASMERGRVWLIRVTAVMLGLAVGLVGYEWLQPAERKEGALAWEPFTVEALDRGLGEGRVVVVDWTANWCINCRFVEATVLDSAAVEEAVRKHNVLLLRADISERSPAAEALLGKLGSRSIPVLAVFSPRRPEEPVVLRDVYTRDRVVREVEGAER